VNRETGSVWVVVVCGVVSSLVAVVLCESGLLSDSGSVWVVTLLAFESLLTLRLYHKRSTVTQSVIASGP
jgi:hypothetical protein